VSLSLQSLGCDQALNLGRFEVWFLAILGDLSFDDVGTNIILLCQVEELADSGSSFRTEATRLDGVSQAGNFSIALLDNDEVQNRQI